MTRPGERAQEGGKFDEDVMEKTLKAMFNSTFFWGQEDGVDSNASISESSAERLKMAFRACFLGRRS